jgi:sugar phosphate isomerase/epimerase
MKLAYMMATPEVATMSLGWVGDPDQICGELAEIGYGGVELQLRDPGAFDAGKLLAAISGHGLAVTGISTGPVSGENLFLTSPDESVRAEAVRRLSSALRVASEYQTHLTLGRVRGFARWAPNRAVGEQWLRDGVSRLAERAEALGVTLVLEPQHRGISDMWNTIEQTLAFAASIGSPAVAIEADVYHMVAEERGLAAGLITAQASGLLTHLQVSDSNRLAPGWGQVNWAEFVATVQALRYQHWISVEADQTPDSRSVARHSHALLTGLWAGAA